MVRRRHAEWCLGFAERFWAVVIRGPVAPEWLRRVATEQDNLRAALNWLQQSGDGENLLRLAGAVWPFWLFRGHLSEGLAWLERALATAPAAPAALRARALRGVGLLARSLGDAGRSIASLEANPALAQASGDVLGTALSLHMLALVELGRGEYERAGTLRDEALACYETLEECEAWITLAGYHLGLIAYGQGDLERAATVIEGTLDQHRRQGDRRGEASSLLVLGLVAVERDDPARAAARLGESLALWDELGIQEGPTAWLAAVATLAAAHRQPELAGRLFGTAAALSDEIGLTFRLPERAAFERATARARAAIGEAGFAAAQREGRGWAADHAIAVARDFLAAPVGAVAEPLDSGGIGLTPHERQVLQLLTEGRSNLAIAAALTIERSTVMSHVASILKKLGVDSRTAAVAAALRRGLV